MDKSSNKRQARPTANTNQTDMKNFRSLICDESGIIIGEMVYRCLICSFISESMDEVRAHHATTHVDIEDISSGEFRYVNSEQCASQSLSSETVTQQIDALEAVGGIDEKSSGANGSGAIGNKNKSGYITCSICSTTKFYSYVQRRYGKFTCSACYRHFREFLLKPKVYACPNLGSCSIDDKNKCRACWLLVCINVYSGNVGDKQKILETFKPVVRLESDTDNGEIKGGEEENKKVNMQANEIDDTSDLECEINVQGDEEKTENELTAIKSSKNDQETSKSSIGLPNVPGAPNALTSPILQTIPAQSSDCNNNSNNDLNNNNGSTSNKKVEKLLIKITTKRKRNWSCKKCVNCLKEECGRCIYCLDRPKYGGQFRLRQRCANRRCLFKIKDA